LAYQKTFDTAFDLELQSNFINIPVLMKVVMLLFYIFDILPPVIT